MVKTTNYVTVAFASLVFTCGAGVSVWAQGAGDMAAPAPFMEGEISFDAVAGGQAGTGAEVAPVTDKVATTDEAAAKKEAVIAKPSFDDLESFGMVVDSTETGETVLPSEKILGPVDNAIFREMAAIEQETALLTLKAKREKLLSEIETSKAQQRKNQLDELERRELITRNRSTWEAEQEKSALKRGADGYSSSSYAQADEGEDITAVYSIVEIQGVGSDLYATLSSASGTVKVKEGHPLKGGFKVSKITPSFVEVRRGGDIAILSFAEGGAGVVSGMGSAAANRRFGNTSTGNVNPRMNTGMPVQF